MIRFLNPEFLWLLALLPLLALWRGRKGRVAAIEIMVANSAIRNLIRENKAHQMTSMIQTGAGDGMQTMDQALRDLVQQSLVSYEVAMQRCQNPLELEKLLAGTE